MPCQFRKRQRICDSRKRGGCHEREEQRNKGKQESPAEKFEREEKVEEGEEEQGGDGSCRLVKERLKGDEMKIVNVSQVSKEPNSGPLFTGPDVTRQVLVPDSKEFNVNLVNFGKGVRNKFHSHDSEQILIITAGKGIVATEREERVVTPGDIIFFTAGEKHWHGATKESEFSHIYVSRLGNKLTQLEE